MLHYSSVCCVTIWNLTLGFWYFALNIATWGDLPAWIPGRRLMLLWNLKPLSEWNYGVTFCGWHDVYVERQAIPEQGGSYTIAINTVIFLWYISKKGVLSYKLLQQINHYPKTQNTHFHPPKITIHRNLPLSSLIWPYHLSSHTFTASSHNFEESS